MKISLLLSLVSLGLSGILHADTSSPKPTLLSTMSQEKRDFERNDPRGVQPNYWVAFSNTTQQQLDTLSDEQLLRLIPSITGEDEMASFLRYALLKNIDAKENILRALSPDGHLEVTVSNWGYVHEMKQYKGLTSAHEAVLLRLGSYGKLLSAQQTARYTRYIVQNNNSIRVTYLACDAQFNDKSAMQTLTFRVDEGASLPQQLGTIDRIIEHFVPYFDCAR